jgi:hypothetical protein
MYCISIQPREEKLLTEEDCPFLTLSRNVLFSLLKSCFGDNRQEGLERRKGQNIVLMMIIDSGAEGHELKRHEGSWKTLFSVSIET